MPNTMILGIDIGTSAVKAIAWSDGQVRFSASKALTVQSPNIGWSEQDPDAWWAAVLVSLSDLAQQGCDLSQVRGIGLSGQMHGAVLLDRHHRVLRPAILWNDSRSVEECALIEEKCPEIGHLAGVRPLPGFTAPKISWVRKHEPDIHDRIDKVLLPKDYIGFRLHGKCATDVSDAAGTLWLDQANGEWSEQLAEISDTPFDALPELFRGHECVGGITPDVANSTGLPKGCPVFAGGGDAATGAVAMGAIEPGCGFISLGTSGQLFVSDNQYRPNPERFVHAFAHTVPDRWYQMAAMLNGARPISWLAGIFGIDPNALVELAQQVESDRIPVFLPYLTGERSPHGDPHIRAGFFGLEDSSDRASMARAVVEAVAFSFADAAESFGEGLGGISELTAIGGGAQSNFVLQLVANTTGIRIGRSADVTAGPAVGAAKLAACGIGEMGLEELAERPNVDVWFDPEVSPALLDRLERFRALYQSVKGLN